MYIKENGDFMLLRFTFKNFKSFCDEAVLDLTASSITEHKDSLITVNNIDILPIAAIFGANGSGKSNLIEAFNTMRIEITGYCFQGLPKSLIETYCFDDKKNNSPTEFEVCIYSKKFNKEFRYGFSRTSKEVFEEWLFSKTFSKTPTVKEKCVFYRRKDKELETDLTNQKELNEIKYCYNITKNNELVITTIGMRQKCIYQYIFNWFYNPFMILELPNIDLGQYDLEILYDDKELLQNIETIINRVEPSILGIKIQREVTSKEEYNYEMYSLYNKNDKSIVKIPFSKESSGIRKLFLITLNILRSLENGDPLFIDDLDSNFHPLLLRFIIKLYKDKSINKNGSQLIFSSHNLICLDFSDLRRDEIWFVEKNNQKSTMFSLYDFKEETIRKDLDIGKHYLKGRFGAVPFNDEM